MRKRLLKPNYVIILMRKAQKDSSVNVVYHGSIYPTNRHIIIYLQFSRFRQFTTALNYANASKNK